ncbi:pyridoxal-phosphate dependent enzyme [Nocardia rhamnosiphila]|uniref:pyridoxal-phosphate dependent enzyme n=1 Tax=Nocardia rhamnosiphila TaxID=426716 RepID=UPI0033FE30F0
MNNGGLKVVLVEPLAKAIESMASGISQRLRRNITRGVDRPLTAVQSADVDAASLLRAPTSDERWQALARVAESGLPAPKIFHSADLDVHGGQLHIALENLHPGSRSIKDRAARVVIGNMTDLPPGTSVLIASSGNHAIAYAQACRRRGLPVTAVVPANAPEVKVAQLEEYGATIIRHGSNYNDAYEHAKQLTLNQGGIFMDLSSYGSVATLGTVVHDMLSQRPNVDVVILPAGGGTIASAAQVVRDFQQIWRPDNPYKVLIACPEYAASVYESFRSSRQITIRAHSAAADATSVSAVDAHLLPVIREHADDVVLIPERWIDRGIPLISNAIGHPVEGAGTLGPMAVIGSHGVLHGASGAIHDIRGLQVLTIASGGNVDPIRLA